MRPRVKEAVVAHAASPSGLLDLSQMALNRFADSLNDDPGSAEAVLVLFVFLNEVNAELDRVGSPLQTNEGEENLSVLGSMNEVVESLELAREARAVDQYAEVRIDEEIRLRGEARSARDFASADTIRDALADRGVVL
jgi:cysteinyl-tRNA synthetase